jgi:hypothetical protein
LGQWAQRIVISLFMAVPSISSIALLMCIVFYIYAVIGTTFHASVSPDYFGNLSRSLVTLFQIVTFVDWANIYPDCHVYHAESGRGGNRQQCVDAFPAKQSRSRYGNGLSRGRNGFGIAETGSTSIEATTA